MADALKTAPDGADRHTDIQTDGHGDSMTNSAELVKTKSILNTNISCIKDNPVNLKSL